LKQFPFFLLLFVIACQQRVQTNKYTLITGKSIHIPDGMVYLVDARNWQTTIDSASALNGNFSFQIPTDSAFIPRAVAFHYFTAGDYLHPVRLKYTNPSIETKI
jgi:hypothetical protein